MVIRNEEPDIAVGGGPTIPPVATAVPATAFASDPNKNIERTTNSDGSLMVKVTTTAPQTNGYREVTIEYFYVPANMAGTVIMAMDATGEPPSSLYMTKMEQQVLPPGNSEVISHAPTAAAPAAVTAASGGGGYNPTPQTYTIESSNSGSKRACGICCAFVLVFIIMGSVVGAIRRNHIINNWPTPAPYSWPSPPSPWYPTNPTARPTKAGCKDTPGWVDMIGFGCDYYENKSYSVTDRCRFSDIYQGSMGPAEENCCTCGGGSTYVAPTPWPSIAPVPTTAQPTQPSSCVDTPNWKDLFGSGCDFYTGGLCNFGHEWQGSMGSAAVNCCVCGGGTVPSNPTKTPSISSSAVPTIVSKDEMRVNAMDSSSSHNNPFRSPSATKEDR